MYFIKTLFKKNRSIGQNVGICRKLMYVKLPKVINVSLGQFCVSFTSLSDICSSKE